MDVTYFQINLYQYSENKIFMNFYGSFVFLLSIFHFILRR